MTDQEKTKVKEIMLTHLKSLGWPNVKDPDKLVIEQAEPMFRLLLKANLIKYSDWESYYTAGIVEYRRSQLRKQGYPV